MSNGPWPPIISSEQERKAEADRRRRNYQATVTINEVQKLPPQGTHLAVLVNTSYSTHDGYSEREGGGYHTVNTVAYITFGTQEALEDWILENHSQKTFVVLHVKPVEVKLKTVLDIGKRQ